MSARSIDAGAAVLRMQVASRAPDHDVLLRIIESDSLPGLHRRDGHAQRHRMAIAGFDVRIWFLAVLHAFHPVANVCDRGVLPAGVRCGRGRRGR